MLHHNVHIKNLCFSRGKKNILQNINCTIAYGESVALLGANGCGKSTLLNVLSGYHLLQEGEIWQDDLCLARSGEYISQIFRKNLGVVFQDPSLDSYLSANDNLQLTAKLYGLSASIVKDKICQALMWASLSDRADEPVKKFSGGMKKKLEIVRALLHEPSFLILDEASSGLDYFSCQLLWEKIAQCKAQGAAVLMVSHRLDEIEKCDRVLIMHDGAIIDAGTPADLVKNAGGDRITLRLKHDVALVEKLNISSWPGVEKFSFAQDGVVHIVAQNGSQMAAKITQEIPEQAIRSVLVRPANIADAYHALTGKDLAQAQGESV